MSTDDWVPTTADAGAETLNHPLSRMLSLDSRISSSQAAERDETTQADEANTYRRLGWGACGIVVAQDVKPMAFKFAKTSTSGELFNDHKMQHIIAAAFQRVKDNMGHNNTTVGDVINAVHTPRPYFWVPHTEARWFEENADLVGSVQESDYCNLPTDVLAMERIFPLPQPTRTALIDKFCPPHLKEAALQSPGNKECLVRVYLGAVKDRAPRTGEGKAPGFLQTFNLRNFKLFLNDMEELRLDVDTLAALMGAALAMLHWAAKTDARDVEFVLGSSRELKPPSVDVKTLDRQAYTGPASYIGEDFFRRTTEFWVLDYNQAKEITFDEDGVAMAVDAVRLNDPYFPKPRSGSGIEGRVWRSFVESYLHVSDEILTVDGFGEQAEVMRLPEKFIRGVVDLEDKRMSSRLDC